MNQYTREQLNQMSQEELINIVMDQQWAQRHNSAQNRVLTAFTAGGLDNVTTLLEQTEDERDQARAERDQWRNQAHNILIYYTNHIVPSLKYAYEMADERFFEDADSQTFIPALVRALRYAVDGAEVWINQTYDQIEADLTLYDLNDPLAVIESIGRQLRLYSLYQVGLSLKAWAWGKSKHPALQAHDIIEQLEAGKPVDRFKVYALWNHWKAAPASAEQLITALETIMRAEKIKIRKPLFTKEDIAGELGKSDRMLRDYTKYVQAIRDLANDWNPQRLIENR